MRHGNVEAFESWFKHIDCKFDLSTGHTEVLWIGAPKFGSMLSGIMDNDVRFMLYEGHLNSLDYLEQHVPMDTIRKWLEHMDIYRLTKTRRFKSIDYLMKIGAKIEFWFASTGQQSRRDDREKNRIVSYNNNPQVVINLFDRYGEKLNLADQKPKGTKGTYTQAKYTFGAVISCVRGCFSNGYYPMKNHDDRMQTNRAKAKDLLSHPFIAKILDPGELDENDQRILQFLYMKIYPKHIEGCFLTSWFYDRLTSEPTLNKKMAQTMWNATIQSIAINPDKEENRSLMTSTFVTKLIGQVDITQMQLRILEERGFKIAPRCIR